MIALADNGIQALGTKAVDLLQAYHVAGADGVIQFQLVDAFPHGGGGGRRGLDLKRLIGGDADGFHHGYSIVQFWIALTGLHFADGGIADAGQFGQFLVGDALVHSGFTDKGREVLNMLRDFLNF